MLMLEDSWTVELRKMELRKVELRVTLKTHWTRLPFPNTEPWTLVIFKAVYEEGQRETVMELGLEISVSNLPGIWTWNTIFGNLVEKVSISNSKFIGWSNCMKLVWNLTKSLIELLITALYLKFVSHVSHAQIKWTSMSESYQVSRSQHWAVLNSCFEEGAVVIVATDEHSSSLKRTIITFK